MRYLLIDEGAYPQHTLRGLPNNLAAAIFQLEQPQTFDTDRRIIKELEAATHGDDYRTVRRVVTLWLRAALKRNRKYPILLPELDDVRELRVVMTQRIEQWAEAYIATGEQRGLERGLARGREEGKEEGREEGRHQGEARLLRRLLIRRFGPLPAWAEQRLDTADEAQLAAWSAAVLDATTLSAVIGEPPASH